MNTGIYDGAAGSVKLSEFIDYVVPSVHNAPAQIVAHYVRTAAIEFCKRTNVLRDTVSFDFQPGVNDYAIDPPAGAVYVHAVDAVRYNGGGLDRLARAPGPSELSQGFLFSPPRSVWVYPTHTYSATGRREGYPYYTQAADQTGVVEVDVVLLPGQDATEVPRVLYDEYAEALADGALQRLLAMKTSDWFDPKAAGIHMNRFRSAVSLARVKIVKGDTTGPMIARAPRWC